MGRAAALANIEVSVVQYRVTQYFMVEVLATAYSQAKMQLLFPVPRVAMI